MQKHVIELMVWIIIKCSYAAGNIAWMLSKEQLRISGTRYLLSYEDPDIKHNKEIGVGYHDYSYNYEDINGNDITFDEVDSYLNMSRTRTFLSSFSNDLQRETILKQLRYCPYISLCNFSLGLETIETGYSCCFPCSCDYPDCLTYQTCCPDILHSSMFRFATGGDESNYIKNIDSSETNHTPLTCTLLHAKRIFSKTQSSAYTYTTCPSETNDNLIHLCTRPYTNNISSLEDMIPVTTSAGMITYRNKYCAFCNGVSGNETKFWNLTLSCSNNITSLRFIQSEKLLIDFLFSNNICDLSFVGKYFNKVRHCRTAMNRCNETGLWKKYDHQLDLSCSLYISNIYDNSRMFKNIFCLQCNGYKSNAPYKTCDRTGFGISFPFSGLIKMKSFADAENKKQTISTCNESGIYDETTSECLPIFCNEFYRLQNQQCARTFESIGNVIYVMYIRFIPIQSTTLLETHLLMEDILSYIQMYLFKNPNYFPVANLNICGAQLIYRVNLTFLSNHSNDNVIGSNLLNIDTRFELLFFGDHDPYEVAQTLNTLDTFGDFTNFQLGQKEMKFRIIVRDDSLNSAYDIVSILTQMERYDTVEEFKSGDIIPLSELIRYSSSDGKKYTLIPYISLNNRYKFCMKDVRRIKAAAIRDCPLVKLSITDSVSKGTDDESRLAYKDFSFFPSEFSFENNQTISVCVEAFRRYLNQTYTAVSDISDIYDLEELLSITCVSLSIICLFITLLTFALFSSLRTFPGMNTVSLCIYLSVAQSLYLIASFATITGQTIWCQAVGIVLHFSWLSTIFWMNICTFHMFRVLTYTRARSLTKWSLFVMYHIYSFVLSCTFIVLNIGLSLYFFNNIGYGQRLCYISSQSMQILTFGLPVLLVVLANITMFSAVVISVKRKSSIHRASSDERDELLIVAKLSSLTGSTWLFGFIYYWTSLSVFSIIFIILNSSQGVFLMLSFVTNKRIFDLYKTRIQKW